MGNLFSTYLLMARMGDLSVIESLDSDTAIQLIDSAHKYLLDKRSVPLKKLAVNARVPFSALYNFLRGNPLKRIEEIDRLQLADEEIRKALKAKVYMMYAQNFTKVGLLSNYANELAKVANKSNNSMAMQGQPLHFVGV